MDVLLITGDLPIDHPAFPAALLGRFLESEGWRVAVIARPDPTDVAGLAGLGPPRLLIGITAGMVDSMVANYTALRRRRTPPPSSLPPLPDRAVTVYCNLARRAFGRQVPIVAGGIEASLRRFTHYDYWSDSLRRPLLMDCGADLIVAGPGEEPLSRLLGLLDKTAWALHRELPPELLEVPGITWREPASRPLSAGTRRLPSHEEVTADRRLLAEAQRFLEHHPDQRLAQECAGMRVIANPPAAGPDTDQLDHIYGLPFTRDPHPRLGPGCPPELEQIRFAVTAHRGCAGGCAFCSISALQGRRVTSRSARSVLAEVAAMTTHPAFRGTVTDVGGPTANMWGARCLSEKPCARNSCLWPARCRHFADGQEEYRRLLESAAALPGIRHLQVTTGLRLDLLLDNPRLAADICLRYTSGHLKVAPEHISPPVLKLMRKPGGELFERFLQLHSNLTSQAGRRQYVLPYLMAAYPGCRLEEMIDLALFLKRRKLRVEQCQIFTPTPGTAATAIYATGLDPERMEPLFVERDDRRKRMHKALILWHLAESRPLIRQALTLTSRHEAAGELLG